MAPPIPTPLIPKGKWSVVSADQIHARAEVIYDAIVNTSTWPDWSTFVPLVNITSQPPDVDPGSKLMVNGTDMTFTVHMSASFKTKSAERGGPVPPRPNAGDAPGTRYHVGWEGKGIPTWLLHAQRINEIITTADPNVCEYKTWETFDGLLVPMLKMTNGKNLETMFVTWTKDLKGYCEKQQQQGSGGKSAEGQGTNVSEAHTQPSSADVDGKKDAVELQG
ncbi:hypothetical protein K461DRAFT_119521 [Myriangium duriaei CBS 260.36]|uniref:Polyketide cyclase/dehydrase n=1 Tax=Myriangium duriaei CBS 260.36 TaxID=1168546 RepID=A0A9P4J7Q1_9PEZI|nr:hypothetical protein K461DRAFT_119521 [Myriangium duriaei CBS 260.36]